MENEEKSELKTSQFLLKNTFGLKRVIYIYNIYIYMYSNKNDVRVFSLQTSSKNHLENHSYLTKMKTAKA